MAISVRQIGIDSVVLMLSEITTANSYSRDVGRDRIFTQATDPSSMPQPGIIVMQGEEEITDNYSNLYECSLEVMIGFVDTWHGESPEKEANKFLADIQKAITATGIEFTANVTDSQGQTISNTYQFLEKNNAIDISDTLPGYIMGQITYEMRYRRQMNNPNLVN